MVLNVYIDGLVLKRRNSIVNALEVGLSYTNQTHGYHRFKQQPRI